MRDIILRTLIGSVILLLLAIAGYFIVNLWYSFPLFFNIPIGVIALLLLAYIVGDAFSD